MEFINKNSLNINTQDIEKYLYNKIIDFAKNHLAAFVKGFSSNKYEGNFKCHIEKLHNISLFYSLNKKAINLNKMCLKAKNICSCMEILSVVILINIIYTDIFPSCFIEQLVDSLKMEKYKKDFRIRYTESHNRDNYIKKYYNVILHEERRIYMERNFSCGYNSSYKSNKINLNENANISFWHDRNSLNIKTVVSYRKKYFSEKPPSFKIELSDFITKPENNMLYKVIEFHPYLFGGLLKYKVEDKKNGEFIEYPYDYDLTFNLEGYVLIINMPWELINIEPRRGKCIFFNFEILFYSKNGKEIIKKASLLNITDPALISMERLKLQ